MVGTLAGLPMRQTASTIFCGVIAILVMGCKSNDVPAACKDPGTMHDEVVQVVPPQYAAESQLCFRGAGDCSALCARVAQARGTGGRVMVEVCERLLVDGGDGSEDGGAAADGTIHVVYRAFPFCGT